LLVVLLYLLFFCLIGLLLFQPLVVLVLLLLELLAFLVLLCLNEWKRYCALCFLLPGHPSLTRSCFAAAGCEDGKARFSDETCFTSFGTGWHRIAP
jgi:hypothetical protein